MAPGCVDVTGADSTLVALVGDSPSKVSWNVGESYSVTDPTLATPQPGDNSVNGVIVEGYSQW